jgi:hypothetical protein
MLAPVSGKWKIPRLVIPRIVSAAAGRGGAGDVWRVQWACSFTPNKVIGVLAVIAAFTGAALVQYTRTVFHYTHHVICADCARRVRVGRVISFGISYVGLFLSLSGLGLGLALGAWWYLASNAHDRALAQTWIPFPVIALVAGIALVRPAIRFSLPAALRPLIQYPFRCTTLSQSGNVSPA